MMMRLLALSALVVVSAGCASRGPSGPASSPAATLGEDDRTPRRTAGWCAPCNMDVCDGHRCGLTVPCSLCGREQGRRHVHEVVWTCSADNCILSETHVCNDAKTCDQCRRDKRSLLGTRACRMCYRQAPPTSIHGVTTYCQGCNLEVGANHIHGKTEFCLACLREAGAGHIHDATRLCMQHEVEHGPDHVHGTTEYCKPCHRDCGTGHKHGLTEWCWRCNAEMEWPHSHY